MTELGGRSAEEREAARLERELRRAEVSADGHAQTPPPDPLDPPAPPPATAQRPAPRPRVPRTPRVPRRRSWAGRVLAIVALVLTALILWFLIALFQPFHGSAHGSVVVTIPRNASTGQIADLLDRQGVISCAFPSCSFLFGLRAKLDGVELRSGTYHLKQGMTFSSVLTALTRPPPAAKVTEVTIVPGRTRAYIAARLHDQHVKGNYLAVTRRSRLLRPTAYGAPRNTPSLEGFLYPDTYQLRVPISLGALVAAQLKDFKRHFGTVKLSYARSHHLTPYDVLTIASIVERESNAHDRALIASVIYNRLRLGMALQMDATVRYAVNNFTKPITVSQLHSPSPWNTYTHKGLPPTPIDGPSLASIQAAAHPASTNYLFFVVKPCGNGASVFASNYAQFQREEQRYQSARSRRGGRSPEHCSK
ncbi:MAG: endolytic transglycosylase MltG [Solirubrobacteraceae bacterium]